MKVKLNPDIFEQLKKIEGHPIGKNEDMLYLSDTPHYTCFPNPWIEDFIKRSSKLESKQEKEFNIQPYSSDVSESKGHPIYLAHSYHTKIPHRIIMRYILHYTKPDDLILDGFCGSGMTGVAAQLCNNSNEIKELGYSLDKEGHIYNKEKRIISKKGNRNVILNDLSPAATFLTYNYNEPVKINEFRKAANDFLKEIEKECSWLYKTIHRDDKFRQKTLEGNEQRTFGTIRHVIWSDVFICSNCNKKIVFWDAAVNKKDETVNPKFNCTNCGSKVEKSKLRRALQRKYDVHLDIEIEQNKIIPVQIIYSVNIKGKEKTFRKKPDGYDLNLIKEIGEASIPYWYPINKIPDGDKLKEPIKLGRTHIHQLYTKRNLWVISKIMNEARKSKYKLFLFGALNTSWHATLMRRYNPRGGDRPLPGTYYFSSIPSEGNLIKIYSKKLKQIIRMLESKQKIERNYIITTQSSTNLAKIASKSIDYIFIDPPFGANLMYSELNYLWESWLKVFTNNNHEAIVNKTQKKDVKEYQELMEKCFHEFHRVLKKGSWMTVVFHNSSNEIWNAFQKILLNSGFIIADVKILDKKHGTFNQLTRKNAVEKDLVLSVYKTALRIKDKIREGTSDQIIWDIIEESLRILPKPREDSIKFEIIEERKKQMLYDRLIAFLILKGFEIPITASEFYKKLENNYECINDMYFLKE